MATSSAITVLAAVRIASIARYREHLMKDPQLQVQVVTNQESAQEILDHPDRQVDVFVVDNGLANTNVFEWIKTLRQTNPRLLICLVDEEADFGMPGRADDVSTDPFRDDELIRKIKRMAEERRLATLRADALPPIRSFAKALRKATKSIGKQQAAVSAVQDLGYDHVAYYAVAPGEPPALTLGAQVGPNAVMGAMPARTDYAGILGWVAQHGESKVIGPDESPSHFLVERGRYGAGVCVPVGTTLRFGVLIAFREAPGSIRQENIVMLELISAQLASALAKEHPT